MSDATSVNSARGRRWLILGVIGLAQLPPIDRHTPRPRRAANRVTAIIVNERLGF